MEKAGALIKSVAVAIACAGIFAFLVVSLSIRSGGVMIVGAAVCYGIEKYFHHFLLEDEHNERTKEPVEQQID